MNTEQTTQNNDLAECIGDLEFGEFQVPYVPSLQFTEIQYMKKVSVLDGPDEIEFTGWCIRVGQDPELDALFKQLAVPFVRIRHFTGNIESYWQFTSLKGVILCKSVPMTKEYSVEVSIKTAIPYVWNSHLDPARLDKEGKKKQIGSQLQVLFFLCGLMELGYTRPLIISLSRTVTDFFVTNVLHRQSGVIELIKNVLRKQNRATDADNLAIYALWVELIAGTHKVPRADGDYLPPVTTIPSPLTSAYLNAHKVPESYKEIIENFAPSLDAWVRATVARLIAPRDNEAGNNEEVMESNSVPSVSGDSIDLTIINRMADKKNLPLYRGIQREKQRGVDARIITCEADWDSILIDLKITVFDNPIQIKYIHDYIVKMMADIQRESSVS